MSDCQIVAFVFASLLIPLTAVCVVVPRNSAKRKKRCTQEVVAKVERVVHKSIHAPGSSFHSYYIVEYSFGNYDYKTSLFEMVGNPQVGDTVTIYVDPILPENVYVEGVVESAEREVRRAAVVCIFLVIFFLLILLVA